MRFSMRLSTDLIPGIKMRRRGTSTFGIIRGIPCLQVKVSMSGLPDRLNDAVREVPICCHPRQRCERGFEEALEPGTQQRPLRLGMWTRYRQLRPTKPTFGAA